MIYLQLFFEFFKTGLFSIGGGMATIPFLYDMAQRLHWFDQGFIADMIAISESTPGPIGVNIATYAGFEVGGVLGAIVATVGLVAPSVIVIILIAKFLNRFNENPLVQSTFYGLRPAVIALIGAAAFEVVKITLLNLGAFAATNNLLDLFNYKALILFALLLFGIFKFKKHPVIYIAIAALAGIVFKF